MRRLAPLLLLPALLLRPGLVHAQSVANYPVARTTGNAYVSISATGTSFAGWLNGTDTDDNRAPAPIGFTFHYMGNAYTQFNVSTNGFVDFSTSTVPGSGTGAYGHANPGFATSGGTTLTAVAPFYEQITTSGSPGTLASLTASMKYLTTGVAPNRVLTVEWINMDLAAVANSALNFQLKLFETGRIEFNYATMTAGSGTYSYTCGINGLSMDPVPTPAQLLTQQAANTATFSNTPQNVLTTLPLAGSRLAFVPVQNVTPAAPGPLSFTAVQQTTMSVSIPDHSTTETFFRVQISTDGVNFTTALIVTSTSTPETFSVTYQRALTGLTPGTVYTIRVTAENEASAPSTPVTIVQPTRPRGIYTVATGYWSDATIWSGGMVPTASDTVTILGGQQVAMKTTSTCKRLVVGDSTFSTGVLQWDPVTPTQLEVAGDVLVHPGSLLIGPVTGTQTAHTFRVQGDLTNNGTLNLSTNGNTAGVTLLFVVGTKPNVIFSGSGSTTNLMLMTVVKGAGVNLTVSPSTLTVRGVNTDVAGFLSLSSGILKFAGTYTLTNRLFTSAGYAIGGSAGLWLANPNMTVAAQAATVFCAGEFHVTAGTYNVGTALNHSFLFNTGSSAIIGGGTVNVAGLFGVSAPGQVISFSMLGGKLSVQTVGQNSTTLAGFDMGTSGVTSMTLTGGTIVIAHPSTAGSGPRDYRGRSGPSETGFTQIQFGTATSGAQTFFGAGSGSWIHLISATGPQTLNLIGGMDLSFVVQIDVGTTLNLNGQTLTIRGSSMTLNGTLTGTTAGSELRFENHLANAPATRPGAKVRPTNAEGNGPVALTGNGVMTVPLQKLTIDCPYDFHFGPNFLAPLVVETVNLLAGNVFDVAPLTIGDGGAQEAIIGIGNFLSLLQSAGADAVTAQSPQSGGQFSSAPNFNIGAGGLKVAYGYIDQPRSTGFEIPSSRVVRDLAVAAGDHITIGGGNLSLTNSITLSIGDAVVFSSADSMLTFTTTFSTLAWAVNSYVAGPLGWQVNAAGGSRTFPIGRDGAAREVTLTGLNTGGIQKTFVAEVIAPTSATATLPLRRVDQVRAWRISPDLPSGSHVMVTYGADDDLSDPAVARVAQALAASGPFHSLGGTASSPPTQITSTINASSGQVFFTLASEAPSIRVIHPEGPTSYMIGQPTTIHWLTFDNVHVTGVDLAISRNGGAFTPIATGVKDSTFAWVVTGPPTMAARFQATLHDQMGGTASDINDVPVPLISAAVEVEPETADGLQLAPPAPNPVTRSTRVRFEMPQDGDLRLAVFDLGGRRIALLAEGRYPAGRFEIEWNAHAASVPTGLYLVRLETSLGRRVQRVVIMN